MKMPMEQMADKFPNITVTSPTVPGHRVAYART